ncbi:Sensor histidine kinase TmoS, partial [termite gut metagenome]
MKRQRLYSILFLFFAFLPVSAIPSITVEHYTVNRGLPSNLVYCSLKDSDGFMWFGTLYGLCSFDGIKFKIYNNHDSFFYSENPPRKIQTIAEDKNGFLWIKTADEKAYVFDRKKERFHLLCNEAENHAEGTTVIKIQKTPDGEIFILTGDKKLLCACTTSEKPTDVQLLHDFTPSLINGKDSFLTHNVLGETNEFINWIGADYHIYSYRKGTDLAKKHSNVILAEIGM